MAVDLQVWIRSHILDDIQNSKWYRTAPEHLRANMLMKFIGVEKRMFHGLGTARQRDCLVVECEIGGEKQEYVVLLDQLSAQCSI